MYVARIHWHSKQETNQYGFTMKIKQLRLLQMRDPHCSETEFPIDLLNKEPIIDAFRHEL